MRIIKTIDAEIAGEAVRLIVAGAPTVQGRTMAERLNWLRKNGDGLRRLLMLEPRGHAGMHGALFTEPVSPDAHAGLLSMHAGGFPLVSGEGIIGAVTLALEHKLIGGAGDELIVDTPVGAVRARPQVTHGRIAGVALTLRPSFVYAAGQTVQTGRRQVAVDIAFGGEFYAIADSEAIGIPIDLVNETQLVRVGLEITQAIESSIDVVHPADPRIKGLHGVMFTGPARAVADLRSATVLRGGVLRRSPGATGTAALLAVLDAMGLASEEQTFVHEGVLGTTLLGRALSHERVGELTAIVPTIEGAATTTGFHEFCIDD